MRASIASCYLSAFLPLAAKTALDGVLDQWIGPARAQESCPLAIAALGSDRVDIGGVTGAVCVPESPALVPNVTFHPVRMHVAQLREMLKDWNAGEHLLLIGNQGVGKNVLADTLLQTLRWVPRRQHTVR